MDKKIQDLLNADKDKETETIDEEIIKLTGKEHPNYLLLMQCVFQKKYKIVIMKQ